MVTYPGWPPGNPFPESQQDSTGAGPDFPGSSGDREHGKFRPSATPRLDLVAVAGDDGKPVTKTVGDMLAELIFVNQEALEELRLLRDERGVRIDRIARGLALPVTARLVATEQLRAVYGATSGAFDANDAVGNVMRFAKDVDGNPLPKRGRILSAICIDQADQASLLTAHVFAGNFIGAASDAAYTASAADMARWVANVVFSVMNDEGSARGGQVPDINTEYYNPDRFLDVQFSTTGTPTMAEGTMPLLQLFVLVLED